jgi:cyclopropane fatty-acyl-phospholipid synthase-like methyltransferase
MRLSHGLRLREGRISMEPPFTNTYVFDPESPTELGRLINQDHTMTAAMGGPLSGITDRSSLSHLLDLGCGPGGWVLDAAFALPDAEVEGVDISRIMVDYANARARSQQLLNASFGVMDLTQPFDFPDVTFDIVNARFLVGVLKREAWPPFLRECMRLLRPGGLLRLTEVVDGGITSSAAVNHLMALFTRALWQAGYGFSPDGHSVGLIHALPRLLRDGGYQQVRLQPHALEYSATMDAWADQYHNIEIAGYQMKSLLIKLDLISSEAFDETFQQALIDMHSETFCGVLHFTTVLGVRTL